MNKDERAAVLAGTRAMMREDEFAALCALLVDCNAVPASLMSRALRSLAERFASKARGEVETECVAYPAELMCRSKSLMAAAEGYDPLDLEETGRTRSCPAGASQEQGLR